MENHGLDAAENLILTCRSFHRFYELMLDTVVVEAWKCRSISSIMKWKWKHITIMWKHIKHKHCGNTVETLLDISKDPRFLAISEVTLLECV